MSGAGPLRVSVVIPAYNAAPHLSEAIESVLAQTEPPAELIVVDDGSTDDTRQVAAAFGSRIRLAWKANGGPGAATNLGLSHARGDFFAFLDADDLWSPEKLRLQRGAFDGDRGLEAVFGHVEQFFSAELPEESRLQLRAPDGPVPGFVKGTMLITRVAFTRVGPFEAAYRGADFLDWYARARDAGLRSTLLSEVLLKRRIHASNMGVRDRERQRGGYLDVLRATLQRRRIREGDTAARRS